MLIASDAQQRLCAADKQAILNKDSRSGRVDIRNL
jgi:hypothetical protein